MKLAESLIKIREMIFEVTQAYKEANGDPDLTIKQYFYLDVINRMNKPTYSELAVIFKVTKPAVTTIVNKLINLGCLERIQSDEDRRVYYILASDKGKRIIEANNNSAKAYAMYVEASLTKDELENYINILEKVIAEYTLEKVLSK